MRFLINLSKNNSSRWIGLRYVLFTSLAIAVMATLLIAGNLQAAKNENSDKKTYELLKLLGEAFERIGSHYVEEVDNKKLIDAAINGMLTSLDPHSGYLSEDDFNEMKVKTRGEYGGLGIEVTIHNGLVKVITPIDDTPASKAGMKAGDYITNIDGEPVFGMSLSDAVEKMRGSAGSQIILTVSREGEPEPLKIKIIRDVIKIQSVKVRKIGKVLYLRITSFSENTFKLMKRKYDHLTRKIKNPIGIVLDLRNNPGGLLQQAIEVSNGFLSSGEIVSTRERDKAKTKRYSADNDTLNDKTPMVVLINSGSASASEIVAGALKDRNRAVTMGTRSFGKGSVQTVIPLNNKGAMRLTTARYYTPSGVSIQVEGIDPDIIVEQLEVKEVEGRTIRKEKDLRGRLDNDNKKNKVKTKQGKSNIHHISDKQLKILRKDYQLSRAVDLLHAISVYKVEHSK